MGYCLRAFLGIVFGRLLFFKIRKTFKKLIGKKIHGIELYPASEGFIAYQDSQTKEGMLLCVNHGIFYEFILASTFFNKNPKRLFLEDVEVDSRVNCDTDKYRFGVLLCIYRPDR